MCQDEVMTQAQALLEKCDEVAQVARQAMRQRDEAEAALRETAKERNALLQAVQRMAGCPWCVSSLNPSTSGIAQCRYGTQIPSGRCFEWDRERAEKRRQKGLEHMNKITIIGNLTRDPELRQTQSGIVVCSFTVAVNRRRKVEGQPEADYFRVTVWRAVAESCAKYLAKGRKVAVTGSVSVQTYEGKDGDTRASLEIDGDDVEFLTPKDGGWIPER